MSNEVRLGFVGAGTMGQTAHLANYADLEGVRLVALAEGRSETARLVARRYGVEQTCASHRALLESAEVDAVVAILPFALHHAVVPDILAAGKHCLTEKPAAVRAETARRLAAEAERRGLVYQVAYMKRCDPASVLARETIRAWRASGEFGALRYLRVEMPPGEWTQASPPPLSAGDTAPDYEGQAPEPAPEWMDEATARLYVGFINYYIHQINLIRYLLDEDYEVRYADPAGVTFSATSTSGVTVTLEMAAYHLRDHWEEAATACFERGFVRLELPAPLARQQSGRVRLYRGAAEVTAFEEPVVRPLWAMRQQARRFLDAVRGEGPNVSPAEPAARDLETAEQYVRRLLAARGGPAP